MYTLYRLNANELDARFLRALKTMFKDKEIEISVCETSNIGDDETAYLFNSSANRAHLLKAIENIANNRNLVTVDLEQLQ